MSEPTFNLELMFGTIECRELPARWEGNKMTYRYEVIARDRHGAVTKRETHDGCSLVWEADEPLTLWQRFMRFIWP